ncbi:MAG: hypothetical protein KF806_12395 [Nitrospira sp.]|nr:hypothetical protein [Nitrospira sp.]
MGTLACSTRRGHRKAAAGLEKGSKTGYKGNLNTKEFEQLLDGLCGRLTHECSQGKRFTVSKSFENRVREVIRTLLEQFKIPVDFAPHPYGFPDIVLGEFGVEVKFTTNDTWRSVANSVFESFRNKDVKAIYVVFGKMGGTPQVRWGRYEECVMHVRTSHVPRFEVDLNAKESLFKKFGITYDQFSALSEDGRMKYIRKYARGRMKPGERLWWLEEESSDGHSLPMQVQLFANLNMEEKLKMRAEAALLCPQVVGSGRNRTKYIDPIMFLLTYHGILATRDAFSAGSAAGPERGGIYVQRALKRIQPQMIAAAQYMEASLFKEYWGGNVPPNKRIQEWLRMADIYAKGANPPWKPSRVLFLGGA